MGFQNGWRGPNIVADGLVMYLDAGSPNSYRPDFGTTWKDMSGFNNSGSLTNGPTYSTDNGGSIVFDGVNDWVNTPLNIDANPNTICAWCYPTAVTSTNGYGIVLTDNTNWDKGFEINGSLWQIHTGNNLISTGVTAFANIWQYGCISYTNTSMNFYLNGLMVWSGGSPEGMEVDFLLVKYQMCLYTTEPYQNQKSYKTTTHKNHASAYNYGSIRWTIYSKR
jgi:hypothetical protein